MAPLPNTSINHFIHPNHPLKPINSDKEYLCDGCKTIGTGKRYRCASHGCDFDMHEYCGTCPNSLSSPVHKKHALTLVLRKAQAARQVDRICDVCTDPVEGLFYRCKECEFDVHPLCTQLPDKLNHAMHKIHPLRLESPSPARASPCAICGESCISWRYRCGACGFDIHLQCVLVPAVKCSTAGGTSSRGINQRHGQGIPYQPPPQFAPYYNYYQYNHAFAYAPVHGYGYGQPGFNHNPQMYPHGFVPQNQQVGASTSGGSAAAGRVGKSMFSLVGQLAFGVISNMIFGMDLTSLV